MKTKNHTNQYCLFGASPTTGNLGVSALGHSFLYTASKPDVNNFTVFDYRHGKRTTKLTLGERDVSFDSRGAIHGKRFYLPENLWNIRLSCLLNNPWNPSAKSIKDSDGIFDVSGGDSFTDLYGWERFASVFAPKQIAVENNVPLVLLPQTYGPFQTEKAKILASRVVQKAKMAWARDEKSYSILKALAGDQFNPERYRCGVDMAFALPKTHPQNTSDVIHSFHSFQSKHRNTIGFNISGLLYNDEIESKQQFSLSHSYKELAKTAVLHMLKNTSDAIVFVPHVLTPSGHVESDYDACLDIQKYILCFIPKQDFCHSPPVQCI